MDKSPQGSVIGFKKIDAAMIYLKPSPAKSHLPTIRLFRAKLSVLHVIFLREMIIQTERRTDFCLVPMVLYSKNASHRSRSGKIHGTVSIYVEYVDLHLV